MNRGKVPVPMHHRTLPNVLSGVSAVGMIFVIWGVVALDVWPILLGAAVVYLARLWFLDRMVWLYEDMKHAVPEYPDWSY